jgi:glycosyltransferase involved in cell wall biosynthesis
VPVPPSKNRIAFCITDLDAGGAERALVQLVTRLDRSRWDASVFCLSSEGELAAPLRDAGIPVKCLGAKRRRGVGAAWRLYRELRELRPVLLQTYLYHANVLGRLAGRAAGIPHIVAGIRVAEKRSRFRLWLDRATERLVDRHVCVSRAVADFSIGRGGLTARKVVVIPNGVDADRFANATPADLAEFGISSESRTILFVGRLDPQKDPLALLNAVRNLLVTHRDLHVLMVGDGVLRDELLAWVKQRELQAQIHFAGRRNDVPSLLKSATLMVLSSRWEGMPNVVLEAMAAGTPIVATSAEGVSDLLPDPSSDFIVPPNDPTALGRAIDRILRDPHSARHAAQTAQDYVRKEFTWDRLVSRYEDLYVELLSRPGV